MIGQDGMTTAATTADNGTEEEAFTIRHLDAEVQAAAGNDISTDVATATRSNVGVTENYLEGLGGDGQENGASGGDGGGDSGDNNDHKEEESDALPVLEVAHDYDIMALKIMVNHMVDIKDSLKEVPLAKYVDEDTLKSLTKQKLFGVKLPEFDDVLAIIHEPKIVNDDGYDILMAGKLELTSAVNKQFIQEQFYKGKKEELVPFSMDDPEFDLSTFKGRYQTNIKISNQRHAFYSNKKIQEFQKLIEDQKKKERR